MKAFCKILKLLGKVITVIITILIIGAIILYFYLKHFEYENEKIMINWIEPIYSNMMDKYDELKLKEVDFKGTYEISFDIVKEDCSDEEILELTSSIQNYITDSLKTDKNNRLNSDDYRITFYYEDKYVIYKKGIYEEEATKITNIE